MAADVFVQVDGIKELSATLKELGKSTGKAALRRIATKAIKPMAEAAQSMAPVDDGDLRDSIGIAGSLIRSAREPVRRSGGRVDAKDGITIYMGTANRNGVPREFGSFRSPAHPFMRPAFDLQAKPTIDRIGADFGPEVEKTAARVAKKRARKIS